jgi:hypothetical protein
MILFYTGRKAVADRSQVIVDRSEDVDVNEAPGPGEAGSDERPGKGDRD